MIQAISQPFPCAYSAIFLTDKVWIITKWKSFSLSLVCLFNLLPSPTRILSLLLFSFCFLHLNINVTSSIYSDLCGNACFFCWTEGEKLITLSCWWIQIINNGSFSLEHTSTIKVKAVFSISKKKRKVKMESGNVFFLVYLGLVSFVRDSLHF